MPLHNRELGSGIYRLRRTCGLHAQIYMSAIFAFYLSGVTALLADEQVSDTISDSKIIADFRLRYAFVDQDSFDRNANAVTLRGRLGVETGSFYGIRLLAEIDATRHIGHYQFNSTTNGRTEFPVVADPDSFRLNRLNVKIDSLPNTSLKIGRQRMNLDDQRFVGNVGWRQNEQTFDAIRLTHTPLQDLTIDYSYIWGVNRIFGSASGKGTFDSKSHLVRATFSALEPLKITAFVYLLDFEDGPTSSSSTIGVRITGGHTINDDLSFSYAGSYAHQSDYDDNPIMYDLDYFLVEAGVNWKAFSGTLGYEVLEGNGRIGFATPLATGHKFQGYADTFLTTPADGVKDLYVTLKVRGLQDLLPKGVVFSATYHDFKGEANPIDMGYEVDGSIAAPITDHAALLIKYAHYKGRGFAADTNKMWLSIGYSF